MSLDSGDVQRLSHLSAQQREDLLKVLKKVDADSVGGVSREEIKTAIRTETVTIEELLAISPEPNEAALQARNST
ncbi:MULTISPECIES: hypothetical protein [unclassified Streptomyces]|uniref:hypothetical protein n=1 Tax=unclassified Streptomyces TaxID=2593676 RepID=UPI00365FFF81